MKRKWKNINKCISCNERCLDFIWTTSRNVNPAIRAMYPNEKLCRKCYDRMCHIYPPISKHNRVKQCELCGGKVCKEQYNTLNKREILYEYVCQYCGNTIREGEY